MCAIADSRRKSVELRVGAHVHVLIPLDPIHFHARAVTKRPMMNQFVEDSKKMVKKFEIKSQQKSPKRCPACESRVLKKVVRENQTAWVCSFCDYVE